MVNPGLVLLIILVVLLTIGIIAVLIWAGVSIVEHNNNGNSGTGATVGPPCSQSINLSNLIQIPDSGANCIQRGITGPLFYIGNLGNQSLDYVVAPWGTQPLDVCIGFCTGYTGGICKGPPSGGRSAQSNFDNCMSQLTGTGCSPPLPLAAKGAIVYYAFSPTCNICDNCGHFTDMKELNNTND